MARIVVPRALVAALTVCVTAAFLSSEPVSAARGTGTLATAPPDIGEIVAGEVATYVVGRAQLDAALGYVAAREAADTQAALERERAATPAPIPAPAPTRAVTSSSDMGGFLDCVRNRESGGNYGVYNSGGSGAAGAYQFMPGTWNSTAAAAGRPDLVGVDPAQASPADQDAMARALYAQQGAAPWGGGC